MVWPDNIDVQIDCVKRDCDLARDARPIRECIFLNAKYFSDFTCLEQQSGFCIYVIVLSNGDPMDVKEALKTVKNERASKYPKINDSISRNLYVGSSRGKIFSRIKGHFGRCANGTYALKFCDWFEDRWEVTLHVRFYDIENPRVLQLLEDSISSELEPMFGKQGGNGR